MVLVSIPARAAGVQVLEVGDGGGGGLFSAGAEIAFEFREQAEVLPPKPDTRIPKPGS